MDYEYIPEDNLVVLFLLLVLTAGFYYFWWVARVSRVMGDNPVSNVLMIVFTAGLWGFYLSLKYMQKTEELNGRDTKWYMIFFVPISTLVIQNNLNEYYHPGQ